MQNNSIEVGELETLYVGGGTPSLGHESLIAALSQFVGHNSMVFAKNYEWTLECNPDSLDEGFLKYAMANGVNRFSLGIQSLDSTLFKYLDRVHSLDESFSALSTLKQAGVNFTADLMLGLPTPKGHHRNIEEEIKYILESGANHISLYILKVPSSYPFFDLLPSEDAVADEYLQVSKILQSHGFLHYEVSNFSKPNFESVHNLKYWKHDSVLALGPSATGFFSSKKTRFKWKVDRNEYTEEILTSEQMQLEKLFLNIRTNQGIQISEFFTSPKVTDVLSRWELNGYSERHDDRIILTSAGFLVVDSLIDELFAHKLL